MTSSFKMFGWVPDGIWDYEDWLVRYEIFDGNPINVVSKMWIDKGGPRLIEEKLRFPWGAYPTFPPKPPKPAA